MQRSLVWSLRRSASFSPAPCSSRSVRWASNNYDSDAPQKGSAVSGTQPQPKSRVSSGGRRESIPSIPSHGWVSPARPDGFVNHNINDGEDMRWIHATRDIERIHTESFAFQEWGEVRKGITRNYRTRNNTLMVKWDVAEENLENSWRFHPGYGDSARLQQPYDTPEDLYPRGIPHNDESVQRFAKPVPRRNQQKHIPSPNSWRVDPMPLPMRYVRNDRANEEGGDPSKAL